MYGNKLVGGSGGTNVGESLRGVLIILTIFLFLFTGSGFLFGLEFFDTSEAVDEFHLSGEEGMAFATDVGGDVGFGAPSLEGGATGTFDGYRVVGWMDVGFHKV